MFASIVETFAREASIALARQICDDFSDSHV